MSALELGFNYDLCFVHNPGLKPSHVTELREWIAVQDKSKGIPLDITDKQLLVFHNVCQVNMTKTRRCIESYYSIRDKSPEMFDDRDLDRQNEAESAELVNMVLLPGFTDEGYKVMMQRMTNCPPSMYHYSELNKITQMTVDRCVYENGMKSNGMVFIYDFKGVSIGHLLKSSMSVASRFLKYSQEGAPIRVKSVHILNCNSFFDKIMMLIRPFIHKELFDLIHVHLADKDPEEFFAECVPKRMMPSDFGGLAPDMATLHNENMKCLKNMKPYFDAEEKQRHACSPTKN